MQARAFRKALPMRPGILTSFIIHVALLFWLAVVLAFQAPIKPPEERPGPDIILVPPPPPPPPPHIEVKPPLFTPAPAPRLAGVRTDVPDLPVPATLEVRRPTPPALATREDAIVVQPKVVSRVNPAYPDRAVDANVQGHVDIEGTVAPDGSFSDGRIVSETPQGYGFAASLLRVIPKWRFEPKTVNGTPVPYQIRYRFTFALSF